MQLGDMKAALCSLASNFLHSIQTRIRKQKYREIINISDNLFIDTFNLIDGSVRLFPVIGGEMYWSTDISLPILILVLTNIELAFMRDSGVISIKFDSGTFYIKREQETVVLGIMFDGIFSGPGSISIVADRETARTALRAISILKNIQGGESD